MVGATAESGDQVRFSGRKKATHNPLTQKYGINPRQVRLQHDPTMALPVSKAVLLERLLEAHEHALKNKALGNLSGRQFSANLLLGNGQWALGTNIELSRENALCGERSALVTAWNRALEGLSLSRLKRPGQRESMQQGMHVALLALANGDPLSQASPVSPCSECQSWMASERYFGPDTLLSSLSRDAQTGQYVIETRSVRELLPLLESQQQSMSPHALTQLPVQVSERAQQVMDQWSIQPEQLQTLAQEAKTAYLQNQTAFQSGKNSGVSVLMSDGRTAQAQRFEWTKRWAEAPDLQAVVHGVQQALQNRTSQSASRPQLRAVAYYGSGDTPSVRSLGVLAQEVWGSPDALIVVASPDGLHVRTIRDYMTDIYISRPR